MGDRFLYTGCLLVDSALSSLHHEQAQRQSNDSRLTAASCLTKPQLGARVNLLSDRQSGQPFCDLEAGQDPAPAALHQSQGSQWLAAELVWHPGRHGPLLSMAMGFCGACEL